jgi:flavorubredoxin
MWNGTKHMAEVIGKGKGLKFQNKVGAAVGCYGWSRDSVKIL